MNRRLISYVLFVLGVIILLVGLLADMNITLLALGLAFVLGGLFFLRRARR